jgi:hypothetical protein
MADSTALAQWISEHSTSSWYAYIKRLSANDTGATGGHQSGIYIPHQVMESAIPSINRVDEKNPDYMFSARVDSHNLGTQELRAIYYNSRLSENKKNGRNEPRITQWKQQGNYAPIQDTSNTGALAFFAFHLDEVGTDMDMLSVWICQDHHEEDQVEELIGTVLPGQTIFKPLDSLFGGVPQLPLFDNLQSINFPEHWLIEFPTGREIVDFVVDRRPLKGFSADDRIRKRRDFEYSVFRSVEDAHVLESIRHGFSSVEEFVSIANSVSNRRKSRSGRSLELHLEHIFREEGIVSFDTQLVTEKNKKPDFVFPAGAYHDDNFDAKKLTVLAVKTTLKDRWRQILNEACRADIKYLFTLQEGVSEQQFEEMCDEHVKLVTPASNLKKFPKIIRPELLTLEQFCSVVKARATN